eukprot:GAHX01001141.1.p1 GENE.GAHX01001141.1~~GAHX01001141.1.p1  ORF type:complete len:179 (+),score=12.60 GAHX01001141.1:129-665(+)
MRYKKMSKVRGVTRTGYKRTIFLGSLSDPLTWEPILPDDVDEHFLITNILYSISLNDIVFSDYKMHLDAIQRRLRVRFGHYTQTEFNKYNCGYILRQSRCRGPSSCVKCRKPLNKNKKICTNSLCPFFGQNLTCPLSLFLLYYPSKLDSSKIILPSFLIFIMIISDEENNLSHNHSVY